MAETNFGVFGNAAADIKRGVTAGFTPPNGGGSFIFGFNSVTSGGAKATGLFYNATDFAPLKDDSTYATGGSVRACLQRGRSTSSVGFSVGLFINLQATTTSDKCYILGLSDNDPSAIVLAKTSLIAGLDPDDDEAGILATSSETFIWETWLQLRLDAIVNPNGDVVLKCFQSELADHYCTNPTWEAIDGLDDYIDDALGVHTGTDPLGGGYGGFYFQATTAELRGFVDQFEMHRQR